MALRIPRFTGSLRVQIGVLYLVLAVSNIVFSSIMIFENQTDLILESFVLRSDKLLRALQLDLARPPAKAATSAGTGTGVTDQKYARVQAVMKARGIKAYVLFSEEGRVLYAAGKLPDHPAKLVAGAAVPDDWRLKSMEIGRSGSAFSLTNYMELDRKDFSAHVIVPVRTPGQRQFLKTTFSLEVVEQRLKGLYIQVAWAVAWGLVFHTVFAAFIVRLFLRRIDRLKEATAEMSAGNLAARAQWDFKGSDEIDGLGQAFNQMAGRVEETVNTITRLNAEIQNELEIGKEVQERFLPETGVLPEYSPAVYYRPMREVSGDVYAFRRTSAGRALIFFADATGHGVPAALITAVAVMGLDTILTRENEAGPVSAALNQVLTERVSQQFYMTGIVLCADESRVQYVNAGHPPPLLFRAATASLEELVGEDPPLGLLEGHEFSTAEFSAQAGDRLLLFSDGLIEMESASGEMYGPERLRSRFAELCAQHPDNETLLNTLTGEVEEFVKTYTDDLTIVLLTF